ncbi:NACHT domain-containing protein [Streptomyces prunicolor]|uniref:NACHT domain-containing protein n=1 Tax=Streptomyces prunicolor TaxID=67348 RepID=UPI00341A22BF
MGEWRTGTRNVSAVYVVLALGGMGGALWFANHFQLGAAATAASLLPTLAPLFMSWVTFRTGAERQAELPLDQIAEHLAQAVQSQWEAEARVRRVNDPYPMAVGWRAAPEDLVEEWSLLRTTAADWPGGLRTAPGEWAASPEQLEGTGAEITRTFAEKVPTSRLLVLGEPGAGKTVLLLRLLLGLLQRRMANTATDAVAAVPVLFPLATWNPTRQDLYAWMSQRLAADYPNLAESAPARFGKIDRARALLDNRLILPVLDGFDEIASPLRSAALSAINEALPFGHPVVLSSRVGEYRNVVRPRSGFPVRLAGAAGIELRPLEVADAVAYLRRDAGGSGYAADRWEHVTARLDTATPVGTALRTPLMLFLARTIYNPRAGESYEDLPHPGELCDTSRFPTRAAVETHLFSAFIPAAYRSHPRHPSQWSPQQAQRTFVFLARHLYLALNGTPDLSWWQLPRATQRSIPALVTQGICLFFGTLLAAASLIAAVWASANILGTILAPLVGAVLGVILGFLLAMPGWLVFDTELRRPTSGLRWAPNWLWLATGTAAALFLMTAAHWSFALAVMVGLSIFITFGLGTRAADTALEVGPMTLWSRDRRTFWALTLAVTATASLGIWVPVVVNGGFVVGQIIALAVALWIGLTVAFTKTAWGAFASAQYHLALRRRLPRNLMAFLADAHQYRGVLRQVGAVYQFRHIDLQRHLASTPDGD